MSDMATGRRPVRASRRTRARPPASWRRGRVQLLLLQRFFFLQPVIAILGLTETGLAWLWQRNGGRKSDHNRDLRP